MPPISKQDHWYLARVDSCVKIRSSEAMDVPPPIPPRPPGFEASPLQQQYQSYLYELKAVLEGFYCDHKVVVRDASTQQVPHGGMPLLSLAGFTDIMGIEIAGDPDMDLPGLNSALRYYGVWPEKGPVPRYVLPPACPPELRRRIDEATVRCKSTADARLDAQRVQALQQRRTNEFIVNLYGSNDRYYRS